MRIEVRLYGELAHRSGTDRLILDPPGPISVSQLIEQLRHTNPQLAGVVANEIGELRPHVNLLVNGIPIRPEAGADKPLGDGDRVFFLQAYGGG
jgi:molybdopterin converting factor small subunit